MSTAGRNVARYPYAAAWYGNVKATANLHGVLSVHTTEALARRACVRQRDALQRFWGPYIPWFAYTVVDRRTGERLHTIH